MKNLAHIQQIATQLAGKIGLTKQALPTFSTSIGDATPNIELDEFGNYHYVISERGRESSRQTTQDEAELLYWIFSAITFSMAVRYELNNREEDKDCRRLIFKKQLELLKILDETWADKAKANQQATLAKYPFDDLSGLRARYFRELREEGLTESEIEKQANAKYPSKQNINSK